MHTDTRRYATIATGTKSTTGARATRQCNAHAHGHEPPTSRNAGSNSIQRLGCFAVASTKRAAAFVRSRFSGILRRRSGRHHSSWGCGNMHMRGTQAHSRMQFDNATFNSNDMHMVRSYTHNHTGAHVAASLVPTAFKTQSHLYHNFVR